ncbi:MAG: bifunctional 4-hydroxy-2-oxoglutarate aldolase/2-dehydro-3-deoxy-phosphogluconate aldolase [Spirochaetia bacterium]
MDILENLKLAGLVPVVKIDKLEDALPLGEALLAGDLPVAEVTLRTDCAAQAMSTLAKKCPKLLLGAGTVLTPEHVDLAIDSGAKYIVSPGFNPKVVEHCLKKGIFPTPGVTNPSLAEQAMSMGLKVLKFFPAEQSGGIDMLKTFATVYPQVKFIPTGGISEKNLAHYARQPNVHAVGGSWMVKPELLASKSFDKIAELSRQAVQILHSFSLGHVGINQDNEKQAASVAEMLSAMFGFKNTQGNSSHFLVGPSGNEIEIMKTPFLGERGHVAIRCNHVERARAYFEAKGFKFNTEFLPSDAQGLKAIYFAQEMGGFAWHLVRY